MKLFYVLTAILFAATWSCGPTTPDNDVSSELQFSDQKVIEASSDQSVVVYEATVDEKSVNYQRQQYAENDLKQIPVNPKYNAMIFKIYNVKQYEDAYFYSPKIYAYGGSDKSRLLKKTNSDGTVTLSFPVILVDGTRQTVPASDGVNMITIPESLKVQYPEELTKELSQRSGRPQYPAVLPGCPKQIYLKVAKSTYDVTPRGFSNGDYCQFNAPFTVSVTMSVTDAQFLVEEALYENAVNINVLYETRARIAVSQMTVEFDKKKVFDELAAKLTFDHPYLDAEIKTHTKKVLQNMSLGMSMVGEINTNMDSLVERAKELFFEPFEDVPTERASDCGPSVSCFRLTQNSLSDARTLSFSWHHSKNELTGQHFITWANLRPLNDTVKIGGEGRNDLAKGGAGFETGLTILPGDLVEITPSYLLVEQRQASNPATIRKDNDVCISRSMGGAGLGMFGDIPGECMRSENQWIDTTTFGLSSPTMTKVDNPSGQFREIFEGLAFRFTYHVNGKNEEATCSLRNFERKGSGQSIIVRINNTPGCQIFKAGATSPMLSLVNNIELAPVQYKTGRLVMNWKGEVLEAPTDQIYTPNTQFSGEIMIRGYGLGNLRSMSSEF